MRRRGTLFGTGLVASLARPAGNVTGLSIQHPDLVGKRLELLREVIPGLRRLAIIANVGNPYMVLEIAEDDTCRIAAEAGISVVGEHSQFARAGALLSYGPDINDLFRRAAGYVDRILKGEKAAELPIQLPTKFELVVNLKTARALSVAIPPSILVRADEVIE